MDSVAKNDMSRWGKFKLRAGTKDKQPAVLVCLTKGTVESIVNGALAESPRVKAEISKFGFERFEPDFARGFGYNGALRPAETQGAWVMLPVEFTRETRPASAVASLGLLFDALRTFPDARVPARQGLQMFSLRMGLSEKEAFFGGEASPSFAKWILGRPPPHFDSVLRAMRLAATCLTGIKSAGQYFRAYVPGGGYQLLVQDAGEGLWLDAERTQEGGYRLDDHNVRVPREALIFLAGIAALDEMATRVIG